MVTRNSTDRIDLIDEIDRNLEQLNAMLVITFGSERPKSSSFNLMHPEARDTYLWACHSRLSAARDAWIALQRLDTAEARRTAPSWCSRAQRMDRSTCSASSASGCPSTRSSSR